MRPDAMKAALLTILFLLSLPAAARTDSTAFRRDTAGISERASLAEAEAEHATAGSTKRRPPPRSDARTGRSRNWPFA